MYNKQNIYCLALKNPRWAVEVRYQVRWSINVWCEIDKNRLIGQVFQMGKLTGSRHLKLLEDSLSNFLDDLSLSDFRNLRFLHNGALLHKVSSVQQYLRDPFQQQTIGYGDCVQWSSRSTDLNPTDFFFCGNASSRGLCNPSTNIAGTLKPYYECLWHQRVTCYVVQCAARSAVRVHMYAVAEGQHF